MVIGWCDQANESHAIHSDRMIQRARRAKVATGDIEGRIFAHGIRMNPEGRAGRVVARRQNLDRRAGSHPRRRRAPRWDRKWCRRTVAMHRNRERGAAARAPRAAELEFLECLLECGPDGHAFIGPRQLEKRVRELVGHRAVRNPARSNTTRSGASRETKIMTWSNASGGLGADAHAH